MAQKPLRDWVYLVMIIPQLIGMIEFYPESLYVSPKAPLHFLTVIRNTYISFSGDPFYGSAFTGEWLHSMYYIEFLVQFPLAAYIIWNMASKKPTSGPTELAGLVFACLTAMGSVACVAELLAMGPEMVNDQQKLTLAWGTYFPYALLPGIMAVDMYMRLLRRASNDTKSKTQ
ncbi:unnamed protein product [Fusarium venenatum]|uniref:EXPERA domain-containing protein n=1 Tax=Fusarium venenatum TaxID=56646 RepID=A0A2L2TK56_9HYPO|nr:uncharacterized protein FVRRES_08520 [Fusarium venenatum]CEI68443.1 unnamed protein product [Fusarium venenatum]